MKKLIRKLKPTALAIAKSLIPPIFLTALSKVLSHANTSDADAAEIMSRYKKLHLGCGTNIMENWCNIDLSSVRKTVRWDLTKPLPIKANTMEYIYSEHFIEHISLSDAQKLVEDCYRVLKPKGVLRLTTPNLAKLVAEYQSNKVTEWQNEGWSPATPCQMMNEGFHLWGHQFIYDMPEFIKLFKDAGFKQVNVAQWRESEHADLKNLERRTFHHEIILEGIK